MDGDDEVPRPLVDLEHIVVMEDMGRLRFLLKVKSPGDAAQHALQMAAKTKGLRRY